MTSTKAPLNVHINVNMPEEKHVAPKNIISRWNTEDRVQHFTVVINLVHLAQ